jgi:hypothetical protein
MILQLLIDLGFRVHDDISAGHQVTIEKFQVRKFQVRKYNQEKHSMVCWNLLFLVVS